LVLHSDLTTWWRWAKDGGSGPSTLPEQFHWHRRLAWDALRRADAVVCPTAFLAGEFAQLYELERPPTVIYNGVSVPAPLQPPVQREPDLAVVVGRVWDEAKNIAVVAEALRTQRTQRACGRFWRVEVAGGLAEPGQGPKAVPEAPGLSYRGFLAKPALAALLHRASLCIAPSSYEPFGQAPAEAALAGCAVLANDTPVFREVWGEAAAYFARNDAQSLATMLSALLDNPPCVARLAAAARRRVVERYDVDRMVGAYLKLYHRLLCSSHPTSHAWRG
jgi:glycosyltransferase involved in cell wall biosynthesis